MGVGGGEGGDGCDWAACGVFGTSKNLWSGLWDGFWPWLLRKLVVVLCYVEAREAREPGESEEQIIRGGRMFGALLKHEYKTHTALTDGPRSLVTNRTRRKLCRDLIYHVRGADRKRQHHHEGGWPANGRLWWTNTPKKHTKTLTSKKVKKWVGGAGLSSVGGTRGLCLQVYTPTRVLAVPNSCQAPSGKSVFLSVRTRALFEKRTKILTTTLGSLQPYGYLGGAGSN